MEWNGGGEAKREPGSNGQRRVEGVVLRPRGELKRGKRDSLSAGSF